MERNRPVLNEEWEDVNLTPLIKEKSTFVEDLHEAGSIPVSELFMDGNKKFLPYVDALIDSGRAEVKQVEFDDGSQDYIIQLNEPEEEPIMDPYEPREWSEQI